MLASAAHTLKLGLYIEARKGLSTKMKLGLPHTVAHRNLSFRRFEDQCKKYFEDVCSRPAQQTWKIFVYRMETKLGLHSAHHTCHPMTVKCRAGRTMRSRIRDWPRPTQRYPLAIKNIRTQTNTKAELSMACARFSSTYTESGTLHRSPKMPQC